MKTKQPKAISWPLIVLAIVIFWPVVVLVLLIYFGNLLKDFLKDVQRLSIKIGILSFTAKTAKIATTSISENLPDNSVVRGTTKSRKSRTLDGSHILWVDDIPSNNDGERRTFEEMGIRFTISTSTEDALEKVQLNNYNTIISDMGRPPDNYAGYTLLKELQQMQVDIPFVIYSSSNNPEHKAEALRKGAVGATNNLPELIKLVKNALLKT